MWPGAKKLIFSGAVAVMAFAFQGCPSSGSQSSASQAVPPAPVIALEVPAYAASYDPSPTFAITGIPAQAGITVSLFLGAHCDLLITSSPTDQATGMTVQLTIKVPNTYSFSASISQNGIASNCTSSPATYTLYAPPVPSGLSLVFPATPSSTVTVPTIAVSGVAGQHTINIFTDSGCTNKVGSAQASSGSVETLGTAQVQTSSLAPNSYTFYANDVNGAGLASACSTASLAYTVLYPQPLPPSLLTVTNPTYTPTTLATPTVRVSGVSAGEGVGIFSDSLCTNSIGSATAAGSTVDIVANPFAVGTYRIFAEITSSLGGPSMCSTTWANYSVAAAPADYQGYSGAGPAYSIASGDFNGDGKIDLIAANQQGTGFTYYAGVGDGTLQLGLNEGIGQVSAVAAGDLNGDGKLDIAISNTLTNKTSVLLGKGDGTFSPQTDYTFGTSSADRANWVAIADVNGDGKLDVVVGTGSGTGHFYVFLGKGDGTLQPPVAYNTPNAVSSFVLTDVNGDGKPDIVAVMTNNSNVLVSLNDGSGNFPNQTLYPTLSIPSSVAVGDVNGDGSPDIVASYTGGFASFLNNGDGTFGAANQTTLIGQTKGLALGDFNGDGKLDAVIGIPGLSEIQVYLGSGDGTFNASQTFTVGGPMMFIGLSPLAGGTQLDAYVGLSNQIDVVPGL